jgi:hypothetical protein
MPCIDRSPLLKKAASAPSSRRAMSNRGHGDPQRVGRLRRRPQPMICSPQHITAFPLPTLQDRAVRGPHQSTKAHVDFVRDEMADFNDKSFWTVLPLEAVQHLPNLLLSPLGCVPQRDRRPRLINDLTFYEINKQTIRLAPSEVMQFGKALERVLHKSKGRMSNPHQHHNASRAARQSRHGSHSHWLCIAKIAQIAADKSLCSFLSARYHSIFTVRARETTG